jgi:hypothetical protein
MHVRAFAIKFFFLGLYPRTPLSGEGTPGRGRIEGTEDEGKGRQGKKEGMEGS